MVNYSTMVTSFVILGVSLLFGSSLFGVVALIVFIVSLCQTNNSSKEPETIRYECENCEKQFKYAKECEKHEKKCKKKKGNKS